MNNPASRDDQRLKLTNTILYEMSKGSRIDDILDVIYRELKGIIPFDRIAIAMVDREKQELTVTALKTAGDVHLPVGHLQPVGDMRLQAVVAQGETMFIPDLVEFSREHPDSDSTHRLVREGMRSNCAVPLKIGDEVIGIMSASSRTPAAFSPEHVRELTEITRYVAVAADKAQLIARLSDRAVELEEANQIKGAFLDKVSEEVERQTGQLHRAAERERRLLRISGAVNASLDLQAVFRVAVGELRDVVKFDRASVTLLDDAGLHLKFAALEPPEREILGRDDSIPVHGSGIGEAVTTRKTYNRPDLAAGPRRVEEELLFQAGIRACLFTPLLLRGRVIGTFNLASRERAAFTTDDVLFVEQVAQHMTSAVANAQAYSEIQSLKDELQRENIYLKDELSTEHHFFEVVGTNPNLTQALRDAERVALTDATVLIRGETGTGKELIARAIHRLSSRRDRALIKVNCAALPETLIASELFGHERGAFTGAVARKPGRFELADGGTIFLDEIGDLPLEIQVKILRVLQEREFERVGGTQPIKVDVRIITATNRDIESLITKGAFRQDLYYRLNVFPITLPPLRERPEDIRDLAMHMVRKHSRRQNKKITRLSQRTMNLLQTYHWPGNVRELENLVERAVILCEGDILSIDERWLSPGPATPPGDFKTLDDIETHLKETEKRFFQNVLMSTGGRVYGPHGAAEVLKLKPTTLQSRLKALGL